MKKSSTVELSDVKKRFVFHDTDKLQQARMAIMRACAQTLAKIIEKTCPESRERSISLTRLEEAMFWANASISREKS